MERDAQHNAAEASGKSQSGQSDSVDRFLVDSLEHPEKRLRQTAGIIDGYVAGTVKAMPERIFARPLETLSTILETATAGAVTGAVVRAAAQDAGAPVELAAGLIGGLAMCTGTATYLNHLCHDKELRASMESLWQGDDRSTVTALEERLGKDGVDIALSTICGFAGFKLAAGPASTDRLAATYEKTSKCPGLPVALPDSNFSEPGAPSDSRLPAPTALAGSTLSSRGALSGDSLFSAADPGDISRTSQVMHLTKKPALFFDLVESSPFIKRLKTLQSMIVSGDYQEAYNFTSGNLEWYRLRDRRFDCAHKHIRQGLWQIGMDLQHHLIEPAAHEREHALIEIAALKYSTFKEGNWPLKSVRADSLCLDSRLSRISASNRLSEIDRLLDHRMLADANDLISANYDNWSQRARVEARQRLSNLSGKLSFLDMPGEISANHEPHFSRFVEEIRGDLAEMKREIGE